MRGRKPKVRKAGDALLARVEAANLEAGRTHLEFELLDAPATLPPEALPVWQAAVEDLGEVTSVSSFTSAFSGISAIPRSGCGRLCKAP